MWCLEALGDMMQVYCIRRGGGGGLVKAGRGGRRILQCLAKAGKGWGEGSG